MTFEARDSAAKVVPARFKPSTNSSAQLSSTKSTPHTLRSLQRLDSKMSMSCQTPVSKGSCKMIGNLGSGERSPVNDPLGRKLLTSAFVQVGIIRTRRGIREHPFMQTFLVFEGSRGRFSGRSAAQLEETQRGEPEQIALGA